MVSRALRLCDSGAGIPPGSATGVARQDAEGVGRERERRPNRVFVEPRMRIEYPLDRFSGGQFLQ
jgi:hypothetical protein